MFWDCVLPYCYHFVAAVVAHVLYYSHPFRPFLVSLKLPPFSFAIHPDATPRGGAFAEWDFLRGLREGWIPPIPEPHVSSESLYGSCYDIYNKTDDSYSIVDEYPDPRTLDWNQWQGWTSNDDFVMSDPNIPVIDRNSGRKWYNQAWFVPLCVGMTSLWILNRVRWSWKRRDRLGYIELKV